MNAEEVPESTDCAVTDKIPDVEVAIPEDHPNGLSDIASSKWLKNQDFVNKIQSTMNEETTVKDVKEMLLLLKKTATTKDDDSTLDRSSEGTTYNFDWNAIYEVSSKMIEEYSKQIDVVFRELENVNKKLGYWQEAGFSFDAHRGLKIMNNHEEWTKQKEKYLLYRQKQLDSTVKEIADSVGRLEKE
ncbi:similar to Saccharomyces cerevisiae YLR445W GMC2 Protein involved in meiotic crossing over [Maudiozyma saulgeensis]|uniref:Similar to Saccharomyces cerevisiae YLR445W GMC2 Protein involved in meiotic crossing over n=1 Tax=Maudiozyma saulgeensis TaxID=1789683 RepID=A0A1X7R8P0_9SACH|nr:similar to Saccharomyces cerevisiae YLR445W GMC2 Protein involved in meiotic crossing over [Kazachstania saulgeensis]